MFLFFPGSSAVIFQSTPPARGATPAQPPPLWPGVISIHAPREGGDDDVVSEMRRVWEISIHAPREGGDFRSVIALPARRNFNPRPPRGGRRIPAAVSAATYRFQSTPPARGATYSRDMTLQGIVISIHAPREGGDSSWLSTAEAPQQISIHAPREGGDSKDAQFYLRIFDKQVELLRFLGKIRGGCLRNPEKDRRFLGKSLASLPAISGHLDFAGGGKARPGYPCAVPLPRRAACVRGSGDPPADRCSSYQNAPLFSHIASPDSKSADCLSQNP